jgi:archaemetzincin
VDDLALWWIGEGRTEAQTMEHIRRHLERAFDVPVRLLDWPQRPQDTFDARRRQHHSGKVLQWLLSSGPGADTKVLGVTDVDLFIPILTFVFGEAQLGGAAAVVSTARLAETGPLANARLLVERLAKECVHEFGHALGLVHCGTLGCAMSRSSSVRDVDVKHAALCEDCKSRLRDRAAGRQGAKP